MAIILMVLFRTRIAQKVFNNEMYMTHSRKSCKASGYSRINARVSGRTLSLCLS